MTLTGKTLQILKVLEEVYPYLISTVIVVSIWKFIPNEFISKIFLVRIIESVLTISGILFGFLMTVLTLLLQTNTEGIKAIKDANKFENLLNYNKHAVYNTVISMVVSLILLIFIDEEKNISMNKWYNLLLGYTWVFIISSMLLNTYRYTRIFYTLIKK